MSSSEYQSLAGSAAARQSQTSDDEFGPNPLAEQLVQWFVQHGGQLSTNVQLVYSTSCGFHMRATGPLESSAVVTCPLKLTLSCLNLDPTQKDVLHIASPLQQCRGKIPDHILTYLLLLEQRNKGTESPWHAYIACLPSLESMTTPLWFDDDDMAFLAGTSLAHAVVERKRDYHQQYEHAIQIMKEANIELASKIDFKSLLWAATIFTSRAFISTHILPNHETVPILFPVVDILNHSVTAKAEWDFTPNKSFTLKLLDGQKFSAGEELFNNYAPKQNDELLLGYGFCLEDNPIEQFPLKLASPVPADYARQCGFLEPENVPFGMNPDFLEKDQSNEQQFLRPLGHPFGRYENTISFFRGIPPFVVHSFFMQTVLTLDLDINTINIKNPGPKITIYILALLHHAISIRCTTLPLSTSLTPQTTKQKYALIYRNSQAKILHSIRLELESALSTAHTPPNNTPPLLLSLPSTLSWFASTHPTQNTTFQSALSKHNLSHPHNDNLIWPLLLISTLALTLSSTAPQNASQQPPWLTRILAHHPLPRLEDGIEDADTYTFLDDHLKDFITLPSQDSDATPIDVLDDLGLTFVNPAPGEEEGVFVKGKTENLGVRVLMWGMGLAERNVVPVEGSAGVEGWLFVGDEGEGEGWWMGDEE